MTTKIAFVGSRTWYNKDTIRDVMVEWLDKDPIIISGGANGADKIAAQVARKLNLQVVEYLPDWKTHGKSAGFLRNKQIVQNSDIVCAFWDGKSNGTRNTIKEALRAPHIREIRVYKMGEQQTW